MSKRQTTRFPFPIQVKIEAAGDADSSEHMNNLGRLKRDIASRLAGLSENTIRHDGGAVTVDETDLAERLSFEGDHGRVAYDPIEAEDVPDGVTLVNPASSPG